ncbi:putative G-protein coupled receptor 34b [Brachyhypopomus gauderio]|uniref:putative G-protein coupled receptor 34b n=1 Tax=Brachyhypopomus gauderio TaxID=698409 RepID=UPI004041B8E9
MADAGLWVLPTSPEPNSTLQHNCSTGDDLRDLLAVSYSLLFLLGLVSNLLALWVFLRFHSKKNSVQIFLINLAMADLLLVICLPLRVAYHANHEEWTMSSVLCKFVGNTFYANMYISIVLLGLISIDRYAKLQKVSKKKRFLSYRQSKFTCCFIWLVAIGGIVSMIVFSKDHTHSGKCFNYRRLLKDKWKGYFNFALVLAFWVIYGSLITSYGKIAKWLFQVSREKPDLPNAAKYNRTARKSFFILFLFTLCFVPYHTVRIFYILSQITNVSCQWVKVINTTNEIALLLSALNSCLDPVVYFLLCGSVRKVTLQVLRNTFCLEVSGGLSSSSNEMGRNQNGHLTESETNTLRRRDESKSNLHDIDNDYRNEI